MVTQGPLQGKFVLSSRLIQKTREANHEMEQDFWDKRHTSRKDPAPPSEQCVWPSEAAWPGGGGAPMLGNISNCTIQTLLPPRTG